MAGLERIVLPAIFSYIATIHPLFKILVFQDFPYWGVGVGVGGENLRAKNLLIAHLEKFPHQVFIPSPTRG